MLSQCLHGAREGNVYLKKSFPLSKQSEANSLSRISLLLFLIKNEGGNYSFQNFLPCIVIFVGGKINF